MKNIHIVVIDDGINETEYGIGPLLYSLEIQPDCSIREWKMNSMEVSHGTICAGIIRQYAPTAVISSIRVLNEKRKGSIKQLVTAIDWCNQHDIQLVNISLGSICHKDELLLHEVVEASYQRGMILVAAGHNSGKYTYPASMKHVIGVKSLFHGSYENVISNIPEEYRLVEIPQHIYFDMPINGIEVCLSGWFPLKGGSVFGGCNSYVTAYMTAFISKIIQTERKTLQEIQQALLETSSEKLYEIYKVKSHEIVAGGEILSCNDVHVQYEIPPAILILDYTGLMLFDCMHDLEKRFIKDGYNILLGTDAQSDTPNGVKQLVLDMKMISSVYAYDLLLYGSSDNKTLENCRVSSYEREFDICIIMLSKETPFLIEESIRQCEHSLLLCIDEESYKRYKEKNYSSVYRFNDMQQVYEVLLCLYSV